MTGTLTAVPQGSSVSRPTRLGVLQRLRAETAAEHTALEDLLRLEAPDLSRVRYETVLVAFHDLVPALEAAIDACLSPSPPVGDPDPTDGLGLIAGLDVESRRKTPRLQRDLRRLGTDPGPLWVPAELPATDRPSALGALYVLEGATLGGRMLAPLLERRFGWQEAHGTAYLRSYGSETPAMWAAFRRSLTAFSEASGGRDDDAVIDGARRTFRAFTAVATRRGLAEETP